MNIQNFGIMKIAKIKSHLGKKKKKIIIRIEYDRKDAIRFSRYSLMFLRAHFKQ